MSCESGFCQSETFEGFAEKTCKALQPQNCIYSVQGELICNKKSQETPTYERQIDLSFGVPFYEGNFAPNYNMKSK